MTRKPDFFIVGAPRSGTTSLYNYLMQHPNIFLPIEKEPHFFGRWRPSTSRADLEKYLSLFEGVPENIVVGEASTSYLFLESAATEIKQFQPRAKIIIGLRNPVDRAYSQYWHHRHYEVVSGSFEEELVQEKDYLREGWPGYFPGKLPPGYYVKSGRYAEHVARFLQVFGEDSVKLYLFEDLIEDAEGVCRDIFSFLDVDPSYSAQVERVYNVSGPIRNALLNRLITRRLRIKEILKKTVPISKLRMIREWALKKNTEAVPEMQLETRHKLQSVFREDILYVQELMGRDLSHWLNDPPAEPPQKSIAEMQPR